MMATEPNRSAPRAAVDADTGFQRALALHQRGLAGEARRQCDEVVQQNPRHFAAWHLAGLLALQQNEVPRGLELIRQSLSIEPRQPAACSNLGNALLECGQARQALDCFERALALAPDYAPAWYNRGNALRSLELLPEALGSYGRALELQPRHVLALNNRGTVLLQLQRPSAALADFDAALKVDPSCVEALKNRAAALVTLDRPSEALESYGRALQSRPDDVELLMNRSHALKTVRQFGAALEDLEHLLTISPHHFSAWNARGNLLLAMQRAEPALAVFDQLLAAQPGDADAHSNRGVALLQLKRPREALEAFEQSLRLAAPRPETLIGQSQALETLGRDLEALEALEHALRLDAHYPMVRGQMLEIRQRRVDWQLLNAATAEVQRALAAGERVISPFGLLSIVDSASEQLRCARIYSEERAGSTTAPLSRPPYAHERIRIAYLSADFREHAVSYLMAGVFEQHDRSRFETIAVSLLPEQASPMGRRVRSAFERFIVAEGADCEIARRLREMEVDVAVDLTGCTNDGRPGIFRNRPAAVQVSYLGYPGTLGATFMDYILADEFVIPPASRAHYAEQVVYLPDCFQANDDRRPLGPAPDRTAAGLPQEGLVWCCFNNGFKFNPSMFDIWCRLLRAVPGSVLWLLAGESAVRENLRREAERRGVAPERLVMAERLPYAAHLSRLALADLFLDTLPFNAGATASDALWAGVPVLTCSGESFAARMAGSLLHTMRLPELITGSLSEYEQRALDLAQAPERLAQLKAQLSSNRWSSPLFDTRRFCRHLEAAYEQMWLRAERGEPTASFSVAPLGSLRPQPRATA